MALAYADAMNYRHAFHAGNHADVLKHIVLLAVLDALKRKDTPFFVLDTHAGRGDYRLQAPEGRRTGEADAGVMRLLTRWPPAPAAADDAPGAAPQAIAHYLQAVRACNLDGEVSRYPGSPLLVAQALRPQDRMAACEIQPEETAALRTLLAGDARVAVHARDGYEAVKALLPPGRGTDRIARGLVLIDPPYEAQEAEYPRVLAALGEVLGRWPQATCAVWYPIKRRRSLHPFLRRATHLPARSALLAELQVHSDDSPLRLNGSGMLVLNPPWRLEQALAPALPLLQRDLAQAGATTRLEWLKTSPD